MTFKEAQENYPLGLIIGNFVEYSTPVEIRTVRNTLQRKIFYTDTFYCYHKDSQTFHQVFFDYRMCEGYITEDGESFRPFGTNEGEIFYLDHLFLKEGIIISPIEEGDFYNTLKIKICQAYQQNKKENIIMIQTLEDFLNLEKYEF